MTDMIIVQPALELRVEFARWGLYYQPAFRTVGSFAFTVPADAFAEAPEELLIGAIVDGERYRSPMEDERNGTPPPAAPEPEPVVPGGSWPGPEAVADWAPLEDAPAADEDVADGGEPASGDEPDAWPCDACERSFATQRGLNKHRTAAHPEEN